jgi:hypothetical protein
MPILRKHEVDDLFIFFWSLYYYCNKRLKLVGCWEIIDKLVVQGYRGRIHRRGAVPVLCLFKKRLYKNL